LDGRHEGLIDRARAQALYEAQRSKWEQTLLDLHHSLRALLEKHGYTPTVKYRVKGFANYFEKLSRLSKKSRGKTPPLISDLLGMRIICPFLEDTEAIEKILLENFDVIEVEHKGQQHSFREFGYDSVHLLIRLDSGQLRFDLPGVANVVELQLRTILQDAWAEVEHELVYKSNIPLPKESVKRKLAALNAILTMSDLMFQEIRDFQKEIRKRDQQRRTTLSGTPHLVGDMEPQDAEADWREPHEEMPLAVVVGAAGGAVEKAMLAALDAHSRGELSKADELYCTVLGMELEPRIRALVHNHRGMARFVLGQYQQALQDFDQALAHERDNARVYLNRGLTRRVLRSFDQALEDYDAAVRLEPARSEGYWARARTFHEMGMPTRALADCDKVLQLDPDFAPARELAHKLRLSLL
jgi:putative GTP pyrophosphokinase